MFINRKAILRQVNDGMCVNFKLYFIFRENKLQTLLAVKGMMVLEYKIDWRILFIL